MQRPVPYPSPVRPPVPPHLRAAAGRPGVALAASIDLPAPGPGEGALPEWVQLLPAGGRIETFDHRGPYVVRDLEALVRASTEDPRGIFIDENHATDRGEAAAPAMGWVEALEIRDGAVWGRVAWTPQGEALVRSRAYRGISPVLFLDPADPRAVVRIGRASLVNIPNLRGLAALNAEGSVTFIERVAARLGLPADAGEEALIAAIPEAGRDRAQRRCPGRLGRVRRGADPRRHRHRRLRSPPC